MRESDGIAVPTIVIEAHQLIRQGLASLISNSPYRVIDSVPSVADLSNDLVPPHCDVLVLLGVQQARPDAVSQLRHLWPLCKIVVLFDHSAGADRLTLTNPDINACLPLFSSRQVLMNALDLVVFGHVRLIVMDDDGWRTPVSCGSAEPLVATRDSGAKNVAQPACPLVPEQSSFEPPRTVTHSDVAGKPILNGDNGEPYANGHTPPRHAPKLSSREWQILHGLVKGHANKVIARDCSITEATVKVHMKSILRKIQVGNRTQAAVWAIANGSSADDIDLRLAHAVA